MEVDHLGDVHAVDMVGPEHQNQIRVLVCDQMQVLAHRVGRALEPVRALAHLRRDDRDETVRE